MVEIQPVTWGVTVEEVHALAPHVPIDDTPNPVDPVWDGQTNRAVTRLQVQAWIVQVSNRASLRVQRVGEVTDDVRKGVLAGAVHDAVANGAASYLVAASYPAMATPNDQTSYAAILWSRYLSILEEAEETLDGWLEVVPGSGTGGTAAVSGTFPEPLFPDAIQW